MPTGPLRPTLGLLALTLELYEGLDPGLRAGRDAWVRREVLPALEQFAEVEFGGAVYRREDVEAAVDGFEAAGADALLVMLLTYSPSQIALPALKATRLPIIIWNTQELYAVDETFDGPQMSTNHGVHGTQDLANVLLRSEVRFAYVTSHLSDPGGLTELADFAVAAAAVRRLRRARLGILGYPFPGMGDFALDTTHMVATLGSSAHVMPMEEYVRRAEGAPPAAVAELAAEYRTEYDVDGGVQDADLDATARVEVALRGMTAERTLDGFTYQFLAFGDDERTPTVPFVAASRLMADGLGFGGEGDLIAAAGSALLGWLMPPATFAEMFTVDYAGNSVWMSHMGECNVAMARRDRKVRLVARQHPITRTRRGQIALVTVLEPGPATLMALTLGAAGRWRLIASRATIPDWGPLEGMSVPHFKLEPQDDVRAFLTGYASAGGPHHCAVCFGDARSRIHAAAHLLAADYVEV
jgi:L-arabinose isomerase